LTTSRTSQDARRRSNRETSGVRGRRVGLCGSTTGGNLVEKTVASQVIEYLGLIKCGLPLVREPRIADWFGFTSPEDQELDFAHSRARPSQIERYVHVSLCGFKQGVVVMRVYCSVRDATTRRTMKLRRHFNPRHRGEESQPRQSLLPPMPTKSVVALLTDHTQVDVAP
jgi:hypothetical protein